MLTIVAVKTICACTLMHEMIYIGTHAIVHARVQCITSRVLLAISTKETGGALTRINRIGGQRLDLVLTKSAILTGLFFGTCRETIAILATIVTRAFAFVGVIASDLARGAIFARVGKVADGITFASIPDKTNRARAFENVRSNFRSVRAEPSVQARFVKDTRESQLALVADESAVTHANPRIVRDIYTDLVGSANVWIKVACRTNVAILTVVSWQANALEGIMTSIVAPAI